eukprot:GHVH01002180.1.p1 GENE.GHVH01002180.1~~GHVH01002180.1.p1  ORF type:complete len:349 (+),score=28.23 GHVH01002180.1:264-1310(+)
MRTQMSTFNTEMVLTLSSSDAQCVLASYFFNIFNTSIHQDYPFPFMLKDTVLAEQKVLLMLTYFQQHRKDEIDYEIKIMKLVSSGVPENNKEPLVKITFKDGPLQDCDTIPPDLPDITDFANRHPGGGVLRGGMVQEEILFFEFPECLVLTLLFGAQPMKTNEAYRVEGVKRHSVCNGYKSSTRLHHAVALHSSPCRNVIVMDACNYGRSKFVRYFDCCILSILSFRWNPNSQIVLLVLLFGLNQSFNKLFTLLIQQVERELLKCYTAFWSAPGVRSTINTGRWGCGVYRGDAKLKLMIQWIAASMRKRNLNWFNYGDNDLSELTKLRDRYQSCSIEDLFNGIKSLKQ